jgi:O-antigen/teichoic acid export membrane protein
MDFIRFLKSAMLVTTGMAVSRALGMAFSLILAIIFLPEDFGKFQYFLTLAMILAIGTQPFGQHVFARFIGKFKAQPHKQHIYVTNLTFVLFFIFILSLAIIIPVLKLLGIFNWGVIVIFVGTTFFYAYWGLSSGFLASKKIALVYLGSNLFQLLLVFIFIYILKIQSPTLALSIYGASYFLPIILLQIFAPFKIRFRRSYINKKVIREILSFSIPILLSHGCYMLGASIIIIFLDIYHTKVDVGLFSVARIFATAFALVPEGISTLLLPKTASLSRSQSFSLLKKMLLVFLVIDGFFFFIFILTVDPIVTFLFGEQYLIGIEVYIVRTLAAILVGLHKLITAVLVGIGKPRTETKSRVVILIFKIIAAFVLIPTLGLLGAALTALVGSIVGLLSYLFLTIKIKQSLVHKKLCFSTF